MTAVDTYAVPWLEERRLHALTDAQLLDELANVYSAVLDRLTKHEIAGLDPEYLDQVPDLTELQSGLAFVAQAESITDHFLSGAGDETYRLIGWNVGLRYLRNDLAGKASVLASGCDPRVVA